MDEKGFRGKMRVELQLQDEAGRLVSKYPRIAEEQKKHDEVMEAVEARGQPETNGEMETTEEPRASTSTDAMNMPIMGAGSGRHYGSRVRRK